MADGTIKVSHFRGARAFRDWTVCINFLAISLNIFIKVIMGQFLVYMQESIFPANARNFTTNFCVH